ncbi:MAG: hypothetical protein IT378_00880 [Sandaracinaceae bacterium]|nr:hypothetical protein [Sandaracinaceae bacterium]
MRYRLAALLAAALLLALPSCAAPVLPLPPPVAFVGPPDLGGIVTVSGEARPFAYVAVLNESTDQGAIGRADATGTFSVRLAAQTGDSLQVWQFEGGTGGEQTPLIVP